MTNRTPRRQDLSLPEHDYSQQGGYFVTICTKDRIPLLSQIVGGGVLDAPRVQLSEYGSCVKRRIEEINSVYDDICIEKYVIMPDHIHMIVMIGAGQNGPSRTPAPTSQRLPMLLSTLKRFTNKECGCALWQRGYYDHILRDENDFLRVWNYIDENPAYWAEDEYHP